MYHEGRGKDQQEDEIKYNSAIFLKKWLKGWKPKSRIKRIDVKKQAERSWLIK